MKVRFHTLKRILDIVFAVVPAMLSVGAACYGVFYFGLGDEVSQKGLVESVFYIACIVMIWMYFFNVCITTEHFNYWCTTCLGITVLLRDILFPFELVNKPIQISVLTLSVLLVCMLTYFYARKDWKKYTKRDLWMIFIVDVLIATLYNIELYLEPTNQYTEYFAIVMWIRPTITYGVVACYIREADEINTTKK